MHNLMITLEIEKDKALHAHRYSRVRAVFASLREVLAAIHTHHELLPAVMVLQRELDLSTDGHVPDLPNAPQTRHAAIPLRHVQT